LILLLEPSRNFSVDTLVTIYLREEHQFEMEIGGGVVLNVQENGPIQVAFDRIIHGHEDEYQAILDNENFDLRKLVVKPFITKAHLGRLMFTGGRS